MPNGPNQQSRVILPIPDQVKFNLTTIDARDPDNRFPPIEPLTPPEGAPNILIVLLDDAGFGSSSVFGGPCETPNFEKLAQGGLRYDRFHTTALCAPTRAALLTGRNHHSVNMGSVTEIATSAPGMTSLRPNNKATLPETLKLNGYNTAQFGKCHEVPVFQNSQVGPFDMWPTGSGFEYYYGFIGGEDNQWYPSLYEGTTPVEPPKTPEEGYHLTEDLADHAINWMRSQKSLAPEKPFFVYFAPGATHAPHHVPKEWIERYKGKFAHGWDRQRELTFEEQKRLGVIPPEAELTKRPPEIPAWDEMPAELRPVLERQMETYAAFLSHTDHHVGRLIDAIEQLGILDDTLIFVIIGDNGASAEGTLRGTFNEFIPLNGMGEIIETPEFLISNLEKWGGTEAYNHYAVGWAWAMDSPYQWTKQVASHWGGTRNGTIVHWPEYIRERGGLRSQFCHIIDVAPTILEAAGIPEPIMVHGVTQSPYEGVSMMYSFNLPEEPERHDVQYFEMFGNRGIYYKGWSACTKHRTPWKLEAGAKQVPFNDDVWELYDGRTDFTQAHDLSKERPEILHKLQRQFLIEATKYNVIPLDDRVVERIIPEMAGRPAFVKGDRQVFFPGMKRITEATVLTMKNRSFQVTSQIVVPEGQAEGTIIAQGGKIGGWALLMEAGTAVFVYNLFGVKLFTVRADRALSSGEHQVRAEFAYDGGGLAKGGTVTIYYDGDKAGGGRVEATQPMIFSATEGLDIGCETGTSVLGVDLQRTVFNGEIKWVEITAGADNHSHMVKPEDLMHMLFSKQ
ncbi:MAG: arylsulfatase [Methanomassiliicoccus sp.]|nr:arylsulfatase [Methanomassiliicoccus sp.]